jgi:nitrogen PTS system EIIA component
MDIDRQAQPTELVMTLAETAAYLKVADKTIHRMIGRNEIPATKIGGQWRFFRPMIDDWLVAKMRGGFPSTGGVSATPEISTEGWLASEVFAKLDIERGSKEEVLRSLISPLEERLANPTNFLSLLLERERMLSTAVGNGIAFPHVRHSRANPRGGPYLVVGICRSGVAYEAPDGNPVYLFALYCAHDETTHLRGLSKLSLILNRPAAVRRLIAARSSDDVIAAITQEEST